MALEYLKASGCGSIRYRLVIEGWPEQWVTDPSITASENLDGRTVRVGLLYDGIRFGEKTLLRDAKIEADSISFRVVAGGTASLTGSSGDYATTSFGTYPEEVAQLEVSLEFDDTTIDLMGDGELFDTVVYHIGTEAVLSGGGSAITRHVWDTQPQSHHVSVYDETRTVYVFDRPYTMEGRHVWLYAYDEQDDGDLDGQCVWRGIVARQPRLDANCTTWLIEALPITHVLKQTVAGALQEAHPIGIFHTKTSQLIVNLVMDGEESGPTYYDGFAASESDLFNEINDMLEDAVTALSATDVQWIETLRIERGADGLHLYMKVLAPLGEHEFAGGSGNSVISHGFTITFGSPLIGYAFGDWHKVTTRADGTYRGSDTVYDGTHEIIGEGEWIMYMTLDDESRVWIAGLSPSTEISYSYDGAPVVPLGKPAFNLRNTALGTNNFQHAWDDETSWRVYVDTSLDDAEAVYIKGILAPDGMLEDDTFEIDSTGEDANGHYITLVPHPITSNASSSNVTSEIRGYLTSGATIIAIRNYGSGSLAGFINILKALSVDANDGDTPFITDEDFDSFDTSLPTLSSDRRGRDYRFSKELSIEAILAPELQLAASFMRLTAVGRIGVATLPLPTQAYPVDAAHTIDVDAILEPAGDSGAWPVTEPTRDGVLTTVTIRENYDATKDEWTAGPFVFQNAEAIAASKSRGKSQLEIKPYSRPQRGIDNRKILQIATRYLEFFGRDYAVVTVQVPWTHFTVLCGDICSLTHRLIPGGDGLRGVSGRRVLCVGRRWEGDPAAGSMGELDLWMPARPIYGYAPSGLVTGAVNTSGNIWTVTLDPANAFNIAWSAVNDGQVLRNFAVGDYVQLERYGQESPTIVTGYLSAISSESAGTCTVITDTPWTAGVFTWLLLFRTDDIFGDNSQALQRTYAYVADANQTLPDGGRARKFA